MSAAGNGVWDHEHRRLTIGLLLTIFLTAFEALAVATILPATAADLGDPHFTWYAWVFSAFMLANLVGIPAAGLLSDRGDLGGAARPFLLGCALFAAGLLVSGLAASMPWLVAGRIAQGFGAGALSSVAYVAVARGYPSADQPRMLALLASAWVVPGLIGPAIAAFIASAFSWRAVFLLLVPMTLAGAMLARKGLAGLKPPEHADASAGRMSSAIRLAAGTGIALAAAGSGHAVVTVSGAVAGMFIGVSALVELVPAGTLRAAPGAPAALAAKGLVTFAFFGAEAFLPLSLTAVRGESMAVAGVALTAGTLAWTTGAWMQERLAARVDAVKLVRTGLILTCIAIAGAAGVLVAPMPGVIAVLSWAVAGLGIGLSYSGTTMAVFDATASGGEGSAAAALQLANVLGVALGTGVAGLAVSFAASRGQTEACGIFAADVVMLAAAVAATIAAGRITGSPDAKMTVERPAFGDIAAPVS
jgi:MFS family permease